MICPIDEAPGAYTYMVEEHDTDDDYSGPEPVFDELSYQKFVSMCEEHGKTISYGAGECVHCPRDSPLNRSQGKKITFKRGHLYCNLLAMEVLKSTVNFEEEHNAHVSQNPLSRLRFKSTYELTASQLSFVLQLL
jgi:hypothetical protein